MPPATTCLIPSRYIEKEDRAAGAYTSIELGPLEHDDIHALVAETLHITGEEAAPLAELVAGRSGGNPFFARELLRALHERRVVHFDADTGRWTYDERKLAAEGLTDDVAQFMTTRIDALPETSARSVRLAACIGNTFATSLLAEVAPSIAAIAASPLFLTKPRRDTPLFCLPQSNSSAFTGSAAYRL